MSAAKFRSSLTRVLVYEGGYSDHPNDPGGPTMKGVTQRVYDGYRRRNGLGVRSVREMDQAELEAIYRKQYWDACRCDELPDGIDFVVFDGAVNSGPVQSVKWLQRALGVNNVDGHLGEVAVGLARDNPDHDALVAGICARRLAFMQALKNWESFKKGWTSRVANVKKTGQAWASGSVGPAPVHAHLDQGDAKAYASDIPRPPVSVGQGASGSLGSTVTYGTVDQLQQATAQLTPLADTLTIVKYVVLAIGVVIGGITLYSIYKSWTAARAIGGEDEAELPPEYA
jgi:lysozyme family protein